MNITPVTRATLPPLESYLEKIREIFSCRYLTMTRFGETMAIETAITKLTPARMELSYRMTDAETGALHAAGTSSHFFYDRNQGRPVALKKALPELYQLLQSLVQK